MPTSQNPWFAVMTKPRHEKVVSASLSAKNYTEFLPLYEKRIRTGSHTKIFNLPLFPMYVFCQFDPLHTTPILATPGVLCIVSLGRRPVAVDDREIAYVQTLIRERTNPYPWPTFELGELVEVVEGPLSGLQGVLVSFRSKWRLVVSVTLLQRSTAVEIDKCAVRPALRGKEVGRCTRPPATTALAG